MSIFLNRLLPNSAWVLCAVSRVDKELRTFRDTEEERERALRWIAERPFCEIKVLAGNPNRLISSNPPIEHVKDVLAIGIRAPLSLKSGLLKLPNPPAVGFTHRGYFQGKAQDHYIAVWRFKKPVSPEKANEAEQKLADLFHGERVERLNFFVPVPTKHPEDFAARWIEPKDIQAFKVIKASTIEHDNPAVKRQAQGLMEVLSDYGFEGEIKGIKSGPIITLYEIEPKRGTKANQIAERAEDIARDMGVQSARIDTNLGQRRIGIELPNEKRETVLWSEILCSSTFRECKMTLPLALGKTANGELLIADLATMPHLMVAGTTGSGKSVELNILILSLLLSLPPEELNLVLIDPARVEFAPYKDVPHLLCRVVTDASKAVETLQGIAAEMDARYEKLEAAGAKNLASYNAKARKKMPYIVVVVDEIADLMVKVTDREKIESTIQRLAQAARKAGIHLILATQRPSVNVLAGVIKANLPTRICFQMASGIDSRTVLGEQGAEQLLGKGDMLYVATGAKAIRAHAPFVSEDEIEETVKRLRKIGAPSYLDFSAAKADTAPQNDTPTSAKDRAVIMLREMLSQGPLPSDAVLKKMREFFSANTIYAAKDHLRIPNGTKGKTATWALPN